MLVVHAMLGVADEIIEVVYVAMVIHVCVTEDEVDERSKFP
jgi:hypothetical protein